MAYQYVAYTGPVVKRQDARAAGAKYYFTGNPCYRHHLAPRYVSTCSCRVCWLENCTRYRLANPAKMRAADQARKASNPQKAKARARASYKRNRLSRLATHLVWRTENLDAACAASKRWKQQNPLQHRAHGRGYHSRKVGAEGKHTADDIKAIGNAQNWNCYWCKKPTKRKYHVDHIIPLSRGGTNWPTNLAITCVRCNLSKHDTDPDEFARRLGLLIEEVA
jgi:5-methylcytosine-specific restriction endonuclease McrA